MNAIMDVWKLQYEMGTNPRFPFRPTSVKELLRQKKLSTVEMEDKAFVDRGIGTMVDIVDSVDLQNVSYNFFLENSENGLKHRADNLMSLALCSRGDNMRALKLSTIGLIEFPNEGVRGCKLFRCVWRKSKKNQFGNVEHYNDEAQRRLKMPLRGISTLLFLSMAYRWRAVAGFFVAKVVV